MSNDARRTTTIGEIVNLMSVDAERIMEVFQYLWMIWSSPLQICIAIYLLYGILGPAVFAGLAAILIMFPINSILASIEAKLQVSLPPIYSIFNNSFPQCSPLLSFWNFILVITRVKHKSDYIWYFCNLYLEHGSRTLPKLAAKDFQMAFKSL